MNDGTILRVSNSTAGQPLAAQGVHVARDGRAGFQDHLVVARDRHEGAERVTVRPGDTLSGMVQSIMSRRGHAVDDRQALQLARQLAVTNGIENPNLIHPGQVIDFSSLRTRLPAYAAAQASTSVAKPAEGAPPARALPPMASVVPGGRAASAAQYLAARSAVPRPAGAANPVLDQTLQRAVDKGYIPAAERPLVHARVLALSRTYNFSPDDFARITLMESDGMNPRATNGNCHGIIQFCEGPNRGAASVDMAGRAQSIQGQSVLKQLDLVEKYFQDVGLKPNGPRNSLDDLYLAVLTPAARAERNAHDPLSVAGPQAAHLHVNGDRSAPITRSSLIQGLLRNTVERLSSYLPLSHAQSRQRQAFADPGGQSLPPSDPSAGASMSRVALTRPAPGRFE